MIWLLNSHEHNLFFSILTCDKKYFLKKVIKMKISQTKLEIKTNLKKMKPEISAKFIALIEIICGFKFLFLLHILGMK